MKRLNRYQRAILENQIVLAEALLMLIREQGGSGKSKSNRPMLDHVSARIAASRELLEEQLEQDNG